MTRRLWAANVAALAGSSGIFALWVIPDPGLVKRAVGEGVLGASAAPLLSMSDTLLGDVVGVLALVAIILLVLMLARASLVKGLLYSLLALAALTAVGLIMAGVANRTMPNEGVANVFVLAAISTWLLISGLSIAIQLIARAWPRVF